MRETITIVVCVFFFFLAMQFGLIRTGLDYEALNKQVETLQTANDQLSVEVKRLGEAAGTDGVTQQRMIEQLRNEVEASHAGVVWTGLQPAKELLSKQLDEEFKNGVVEMKETEGRLLLTLHDQTLFAGDNDRLTRSGSGVLAKLGASLKNLKDVEFHLTGHEDNPLGKKTTPSKAMEMQKLSYARALAVAQTLETGGGVDPVQMLVAGNGYYRPVAPNDSDYHRAQNRRIEILLTPANNRNLNQARRIVRFEAQLDGKPRPAPSEGEGEPAVGEEKAIGAEELQNEDKDHFDAGYETPPGK
jgi:flagellar motor protein MotB